MLEHIDEGDDLIVGMFNSEPLTVLDAIEASAERLSGVRIHQLFPAGRQRNRRCAQWTPRLEGSVASDALPRDVQPPHRPRKGPP